MNETSNRLIETWSQEILLAYCKIVGEALRLPIPIFDITEKFFLVKCDIEKLKKTRLGEPSAIAIPEKNWILLNNNQSTNRLRYTLAHELVHWLVEKYSMENTAGGDWTFGYIKTSNNKLREILTEHFAAALLMPRGLVYYFLKDKDLGNISDNDIRLLSDTFHVSQKAMRVRLSHLYQMQLSNKKIDKQLISAFHKDVTTQKKSDQRNFVIIKPPKNYYDNRFVRYLSQSSKKESQIYFLLGKLEFTQIETLMNFKYGDGFIFYDEKTNKSIEHLEELKDVVITNFNDHDIFYTTVSKSPIRSNGIDLFDVGFLRLSDDVTSDVTSGEQLVLKSFGKFIETNYPVNIREDAKKYIKSCQDEGKKVVISTGCFDLITNTHVQFLKKAKSQGDVLVVGVENDQRVRAFKGSARPVNTYSQRVEVLEALKFVDFVFVIHGSTKQEVKPFYTRLHRYLGADILAVTENDPYIDDRRDEIEEAGGHLVEIKIYPQDGRSTSVLRKFLDETIKSDIVFLKKQKIYEWEKENEALEKQLPLPLFGK